MPILKGDFPKKTKIIKSLPEIVKNKKSATPEKDKEGKKDNKRLSELVKSCMLEANSKIYDNN